MLIDNPMVWGETPLWEADFSVSCSSRMAHNPIFGSDPPKPVSENEAFSFSGSTEGESDIGELAAKFTAHGGGRVSPELSADLALQIVLNEIVEQACLATGASGAAIVLERDGEWVCRASAGDSAPQLGARLDTAAGLSGACVKTRTMQRCDDAQADPRADNEACRTLGVRSVIILPLLQHDELAGVFEVFSPNPSAFGERDERTLEALSRRILRNLKRASGPLSAEPSKGTNPVAENFNAPSEAASDGKEGAMDRSTLQPADEAASGRGMNLMTLALGAVVLAYVLLLTVLAAERLAGRKAGGRAPTVVSASSTGGASQSAGAAPGANAASLTSGNQSAGSGSSAPASGTPGSGTPGSGTPGSGTHSTAPTAGASHATDSSPPEGSLLIYENGKEVFRMKPAAEPGEATNAGKNRNDVTTSDGTAAEPTGILELSAQVAEGKLIHRVEPAYPEEARQRQIQGAVVLDVHIGEDGSVQEVTLVSGPALLAQAATGAVKQWRFKPRLVNGRPAEMQTRVTLNFRLAE
jgi:TonB family protein